ncbi:MAG: 2-oxo acid dehydrogenase subunit E2 [Chlamydiota bacterium]|nr:2-oxo acid dehydrogenase subunit E2 [Chlamydiota bacterium]
MDIRLPSLGEGADSGTVVSIQVSVGDQLVKDQTILELENEKAVAPIPCPSEGTVSKIHVKEGDTISVGQILISLGAQEDGQKPENSEQAIKPSLPEQSPKSKLGSVEPQASEKQQDYQYQSASGFAPPASPSIRKMAAEIGLDLTRVPGSGDGGRILIEDIRSYIEGIQGLQRGAQTEKGSKTAVQESIDFSKWGPITKQKLSVLRKKIAQKMVQSWTSVPHVTQFDEIDMGVLLSLRKKYVEAYAKKGMRLTVTPFVLMAVVDTLKKYPVFNSSLDELTQELILKQYYHLGIAVDTEHGLIVPVIKNADTKSLADLAFSLEDLAQKTRDRKIAIEDLQGASFSISNQGGLGGTHFTPIVNTPEVGVLGLGRGRLLPVVKNGQIEQAMMLPVALSYDHRVVDGADAARFIVDLKGAVESFDENRVRV